MKFSIKDFLSKCDQIRRYLRIWSRLLKKSLMENFIFCAVYAKTVNSYVCQKTSAYMIGSALNSLLSCAHLTWKNVE